MNALTKINFLMDQHVDIPYKECPGCKYCEEIEKVSKESGLWLGSELSRKSRDGKKRAKNFKSEDLKRYLDEGLSLAEISRRENFNTITIRKKIIKWFPEYYENKKRVKG